MRNISHKTIIVMLAAALMTLAADCDEPQQYDSTRSVETEVIDGELQPAIITEPDTIEVLLNIEGFRNVVRMCDEGVGIYVTSRGGDLQVSTDGRVTSGSASGDSSVAVIQNDSNCAR